jgi:hypothetical protein
VQNRPIRVALKQRGGMRGSTGDITCDCKYAVTCFRSPSHNRATLDEVEKDRQASSA